MKMRYEAWMVLVGVWISVASWCLAQEPAAVLIEKVLDDPAKLVFSNVTVNEVLDGVGKTMGVPVEADAMALSQLPYGGLTRLSSVQLVGIPWRQALEELLKPLALRYQPGQDRIYVFGTPGLMRQPQRLSVRELEALAALEICQVDESAARQLLRRIGDVTQVKFGLQVNNIPQEKFDKDLAEDFLDATPKPISTFLDAYGRFLAAKHESGPITWYVRQNNTGGTVDIMVVPVKELTALKLGRQVDIAFNNQPLQTILINLARWAALEITFEPGCLAMVEDNVRNGTSLTLQRGTIRMALDALVGMTGLQYTAETAGIQISASDNLKELAANRVRSTPASNPSACVLTVHLPGSTIESMIFVREKDLEQQGLTEAFQQVRKEQLQEFYNYLRSRPTTPPAEAVK